MLEIDPIEEDTGGTVFRDVIMLVVAGFVVTVLLLLLHINPPAQAAKESIEPPGNVMVAIRWPDELDIDVDLCVQASADWARRAFDNYVSESSKITEMAVKTENDAIVPIRTRIDDTVEAFTENTS